MHLAEGLEHLFAIESVLDLDCLLGSREFDKALSNLASLEDKHLTDASMALERVIDHVIGELEDHSIVDAHQQNVGW